MKYCIIKWHNRAVFNQMWPSFSSRHLDRLVTVFPVFNLMMSVTRIFANAGGQPSGTYSKKLLQWQPSDDELCGDWHFLNWFLGMLTPRYSPNSIIMSQSGHGCPQPICNVSPSPSLPVTRVPKSFSGFSRYVLPDFSADMLAALFDICSSGSRKIAQMGNTTSTIKSYKACDRKKLNELIST